MPLYEYRCNTCGHQFEKIQTYSAPDVKVCPLCQAPVERLISAPAIHFSGSGFYETDYNKGRRVDPTAATGGSTEAPADISSAGKATPAPAATSSSDTSPDSATKPATTSDTKS